MLEDFHVVLFSNSSFKYFPENKTNHFVTKLPKRVDLQGSWVVELLDIHILMNFQNVSKEVLQQNKRFSN